MYAKLCKDVWFSSGTAAVSTHCWFHWRNEKVVEEVEEDNCISEKRERLARKNNSNMNKHCEQLRM